MDARHGAGLARRWSAAVVAAAVCGWLSTMAPATTTTAAAGAGPGSGSGVLVSGRGEGEAAPPPKPTPPPVDCGRAKCVALTFDDGPMNSTAKLLDILAERKVKATFFMVGGNAGTYPALVRREHAEGHELGNHSYTHADLGRASTTKIMSELTRTQHAIQRAGGVSPRLMRPPYGSTGPKLAAATKRLGLAQVLWTVDPLDWKIRNSAAVERKVVRATRPGYIVLMHDIHPTTVAAVPGIIKRLAAKGYVFVTVSELYGDPMTPGKKYIQRPAPRKAPTRTPSPETPGTAAPADR